MATVDLTNREWRVKVYGTACGMCDVDIMRPLAFSNDSLRWAYTLIVEVYPDYAGEGVDGEGNRASGSSRPAIISNPPTENIRCTLVEIGDTVLTPFGNYRVEWANKFNSLDKDNLSLVEVK